MTDVNVLVHSFNNGEASRAALNRVDQGRLALFAERQENLFPYTIGKAIMRPGTKFLGNTVFSYATLAAFKRSITEKALMEMGYDDLGIGTLRIWLNDVLVSRVAVSSTVANGDFSAATPGWTTVVTGGATATLTGQLELVAPAQGGEAIAKQEVATASAGTEHGLHVVVTAGPVQFRVGSTEGGSEYVLATTLDTGEHSFGFTPAGSYWIQFSSKKPYVVKVDSCQVEGAGVMSLPSNWTQDSVRAIRYDQSLDVIFGTLIKGESPFKVERRNGGRSWSSVDYTADDGPFTTARTADVTLTPAATQGDTTLTASGPFFTTTMVGALFQLSHENTNATYNLAAVDQFTKPIRVIGINETSHNDRAFTVTVAGTFVGTLTVQRSFDSEFTGFQDFGPSTPFTVPGSQNLTDDDDNAIVWYRVKMTAYTSGSAQVTLTYAQDGKTGICRVTGFNSATSVDVRVLSDFSDITATDDWLEGDWSVRRGFPTAVTLFDGRLWFGRDDRFWGSVSDEYFSFSVTVTGDKASIQRNVATGGDFSDINWLLPLQRLLFGTSGAEVSARSSSFDEPLTPGNITLKPASTQGVANITPVKIDSRGLYVHRSRRKLHEMAYDFEGNDYTSRSLMDFNDDLAMSAFPAGLDSNLGLALSTGKFINVAVSRQPETYVWVIRDDGMCLVMLFSPPTAQNQTRLQAWFKVISGEGNSLDGAPFEAFSSVAVLPAEDEDEVYFLTRRTANNQGEGGTGFTYNIEKLCKHSDTIRRVWNEDAGEVQTFNGLLMADSHIVNQNSPPQIIPGNLGMTFDGYDHLEDHDVIVITGNGPVMTDEGEVATFTVSSGTVTVLGQLISGPVCIGLPYYGRWKSAKLAYGTEGTALLQKKKVEQFGIALQDTHIDALRIGRSFETEEMDELPRISGRFEELNPEDPLNPAMDDVTFPFPGEWDTDSRACILVRPGFSATLSAVVMGIEANEK